MLALREEVEQEYADRMEELRNMYRTEMDTQTETFEREREKFKQLESSMSETLKLKRHEAEEYKSKYNYCKKIFSVHSYSNIEEKTNLLFSDLMIWEAKLRN